MTVRTAPVTAAGLDERIVVEGFRQLLPVAAGVEPHLAGVITDALEHPGSLLRAQLAYGAMRRYGVGAGPALRVAVAIEYFHTASLIFDDMPAMDDARERRGRPCPHVTYGEAAATLGALALINQGYALLWEVLGTLPAGRGRQASRLVASCLGAGGILNGQALDLHCSGAADDGEVLRVAEGKTVSLIRLTLLLPAIVGGAGAAEQDRLDRLATAWGLAYQILDDFKDCLMSRDETGKSTHRDQLLGRPNLPRQAGFGPALGRLDALLAAGRGVVAGFDWEQLGELQGVLERERRKVAARLPAAAAPAVLRAPETAEPRRFAARQLERWAGQEKTVLVTVPAPRVAAEALLAVRGDAVGFLWDPGRGAAWSGAGAAHTFTAAGAGRFTRLRSDAERLWPRLVSATYGSARVQEPRLYGGLAFDAGTGGDELWHDFGDGVFVLPRWLYCRHGRHAVLTLAARGEELGDAGEREACLAELAALLDALAAYRPPAAAPRVVTVHGPDLAGWCAEVAAIRRAIADGRCAKVVAARRSRVAFDAPLDAAAILGRLAASPGAPTRFAFRRGRGTFLGVTPERLIARRGRRVVTEALAGSSASAAAEVAALVASAKELHEHRLVVDAVIERLGPLCGELSVPGTPRVRELGRLSHLWTPIAGLLAGDRHVLELAERLHPTPAVGGTPSEAAKRWIREHEREARGWYAAPVGWFDAAGDGELAVALRCAVVRGAEAHLFAGAGIVAESDPRREYAEIELKRRAMLTALGG